MTSTTKRLCLLLLLFALLAPVVSPVLSPDAVHAQGGDDDGVRPLNGGDDGGGFVERIKKTVTNITQIVIPSRTMFTAINNVLARATSGQLNDASGAYNQLAGAATGMIQEQLFPTEELMDISSSTLPLAAALAVPLFLLRLAIYHWRRLVGGDDTPAAAVGDWIVAGGWAYIAGHLVTFVLKLGVDLAAAAFGSVPQLVGDFMLNMSPAEAGAGLLANLVGAGFMGTIVFFVAGLGLVAAAIAVMWAFAVASGLSFILSATGPVVGVVGVIPQMRWLRSLWLKAVVLLAVFPLGAGAVFKAAGLLPTMVISGPVGAIIRLMWLWGAVGFLFAVAGIAGRFSIGTGAAVGMGMVKAGKAVVDLGATAAVTGGVGAAAVGAAGGAAAMSGPSGSAAGRMSSGVAGLLGGGSGSTGSSAASGASGTASPAGAGTGSGSSGSHRTTSGGGHRQAAAQSLSEASTQQRAAGAARALGLGRLSNLFRDRSQQAQLKARRHELEARREDYLARQAGHGRSGGGGGNRSSGSAPSSPSSPGGPDAPRGGTDSSGSGRRSRSGSGRPGSGGSGGRRRSDSGGSRTPRLTRGGTSGTFSPSPSTTGGNTGATSSTSARGRGTDTPGDTGAGTSATPSGDDRTPPTSTGRPAGEGGTGPTPAPEFDAALQEQALAPPVRRQFAAGFREMGDDESVAPQAVEQLRNDLVTVTGDESLFQRLSSAGNEGARDVGRLTGAYQQFDPASQQEMRPVERLRRAYNVAYGPVSMDPDAPGPSQRDVPRTVNEIVGDIGDTDSLRSD